MTDDQGALFDIPEPEPEQDDTFDGAVRAYLSEDGVVVSWVMVADVMSGDGDRGFYVSNSENTPSWVLRGMAEHLSTILQRPVYSYVPDEGEDE
jgi:hypothetical protein